MADIIFAAIILVFTVAGAKKGFMRSLIGMASMLVSVLCGYLLYKPISYAVLNSSVGDRIRETAALFIEQNGVQNLPSAAAEGAGTAAAAIAVHAITFLCVAIAVRGILFIISGVCNFAASLPVIRQANKLLGGVFGLAGGIIVCYIIILVVSYAAPAGFFEGFAEMIRQSPVSGEFFREVTL